MKREAIFTNAPIDNLESTEWDFAGEDTQQHMHSIHPYPARMIPQIPLKAMKLWTEKGDTILDPFSGCGTTLLEAVIHERNAIGVDNNPVACLISRTKTVKYSDDELREIKSFLNSLDSLVNCEELVPSIPDYPNVEYWFDQKAIEELGKVRACINGLKGNVRQIAICCLSSIIVRISYQDSDTRYVRKVSDYIEGNVYKSYKAKLKSVIKNIEEINNQKSGTAKVLQMDGRNLGNIQSESIDMIITSPPYLNAYDYHKYHRHRIQWIDGDVAFARDNEIGKHDTFTRKGAEPDKYFEDMEKCFWEWRRVMKKNSHCLVVVGDAIVSGHPVQVGDKFIEIMNSANMSCEERWIRNLDVNKKSFNQQARIKKEHVLLFKKV